MNLLEKIEAALDSATPPVADLLRDFEAYVRAAGECEELLLIAHMDGYYKGKKVPDGMQLAPVAYIKKSEECITEACCNAVDRRANR